MIQASQRTSAKPAFIKALFTINEVKRVIKNPQKAKWHQIMKSLKYVQANQNHGSKC